MRIEAPRHRASIGYQDQATRAPDFGPPASTTGARGVPPKPGWCGARPRPSEIGGETIKLVNRRVGRHGELVDQI